ncbi:MAG: hypothetical protein ACOY93_18720 [Bacillota bacterium]
MADSRTGAPARPDWAALSDRVELLAALWLLTGPLGPAERPANPALLPLLEALRPWQAHGAFGLVRRLRAAMPRDLLIKGLVQAEAGSPGTPPHGLMLAQALADLAARSRPVWEERIGPLRARARAAAAPLLAGLDPAREMAESYGEPLSMRLAVAPLLFLPLPQEGRHGVLIGQPGGEPALFMCFGLPLDRPPADVGITRAWLQRGGWHYAIQTLLARHGERISQELRTAPAELATPLVEASAPLGGRDLEALFRNHLRVALRWGPWRRAGLSRRAFSLLAEAQGLRLIPWFLAAMDRFPAAGGGLAAFLPALARGFVAALPDLPAMARHPSPTAPPIISAQLLPLWAFGARLAVPAPWLEAEGDLLRETARGLHLRLCTHQEWLAAPREPAILWGTPAENPAIQEALDGLGVSLRSGRIRWGEREAAGEDLTLYALRPAAGATGWRLVITGTDPARMERPRASRLMLLPYSAALFRGERLLHSQTEDRVGREFPDLLLQP